MIIAEIAISQDVQLQFDDLTAGIVRVESSHQIMDEPTKLLLAGLAAIALGILAWVLPYRWNPFRFKRFIANMLSESANQKVPKVIGTLLIILGGVLLVGSLVTR